VHILSFLYPHEKGTVFNQDHFLRVHLPLGIGLTQKHLAVKPIKILIFTPTRGGDGQSDSAAYGAISSVFFETRAEVDKFATLFNYQEAAQRLSADFKNYTPHPPQVLLSETIELTDMDAMIAAFHEMEKRAPHT
jgi:hypothetical protein